MNVTAASPEDFAWLKARVGCPISDEFRAIKAEDAEGRIHGMVGYDLWTYTACWMHVAVDNPAALRSIIVPGFWYPFVEAGREIVFATVAGRNPKSIKLVEKLGFRQVWKARDGMSPGEPLIMYEMRKPECRWIVRKAA